MKATSQPGSRDLVTSNNQILNNKRKDIALYNAMSFFHWYKFQFINSNMTIETIPIKLYFELTDYIDGTLPLPRCTIKINGKIVADNEELDNPDNETISWQSDKKISIKTFNVDLDDDIESDNLIEIISMSNREDIWDLLPEDPDLPGGRIDYGFFIKDIELNDISIESLLYQHGNLKTIVCPESEFETHGFIDYIRSVDLLNEVTIDNGMCVWSTHGDYLSADNMTYSFKFKTPLYLWLLELLLQ